VSCELAFVKTVLKAFYTYVFCLYARRMNSELSCISVVAVLCDKKKHFFIVKSVQLWYIILKIDIVVGGVSLSIFNKETYV